MNKVLEKKSVAVSSFYENPTKRLLGNGCFLRISDLVKSFKPCTLLLVLGERSFRNSSFFPRLQEMLAPYQVIYSTPVTQNPTQEFIQEEAARLRDRSFDLVLAIGGGSVLDVGKILATLSKQDDMNLDSYLSGKVEFVNKPVPLIVVPTTSGSGSEVTPYASLETRERQKITLSHPFFYPCEALIDPELTYTMPGYLTASTGFDALSQAIESFWSVQATPFSRTHALRALELIHLNLEQVFRESKSSEGRFAMSLASCEAGLAIAQTKTTAVHSVSYPITTHFHVPHGHACALTLASFVRFNAVVLKEQGYPMLKIFGVNDYESMAMKIEALMDNLDLERSLSKLGIQEDGIELILRDGFRPDRIKNNPRHVGVEDLRIMLKSLG